MENFFELLVSQQVRLKDFVMWDLPLQNTWLNSEIQIYLLVLQQTFADSIQNFVISYDTNLKLNNL